jgi:calcineurin-like phosphoesterase
MGTSKQVGIILRSKEASVAPLRQRRSIAEKRRIVEETLAPDASVARVARAQGSTLISVRPKKLFAVMNVMGHTTVSTTMKYQHQNIDEVAEVASHRVQ